MGCTPLYYASQNGHSIGSLPLHIACSSGHINVNLVVTQKIPNKIFHGHINVVKYFITEQKCDPNCRGQNGHSLLHYAAAGGHIQMIEYLISELGCDPATLDRKGNLPLHIACL